MSDKKDSEQMTFEGLFELFRSEKSHVELQRLPEQYIAQVGQYLEVKTGQVSKALQKSTNQTQLNAALKQLQNAKQLVQDIYERREKKILMMALHKSRADSHLIDTSNLLPMELDFFTSAQRMLSRNRKNILEDMLLGGKGAKEALSAPKAVEHPEEDEEVPVVQEKESPAPKEEPIAVPSRKKYKFLEEVESFIAPDMQEYGPFSEGDEAELDIVVAKALLDTGRVSEIQ